MEGGSAYNRRITEGIRDRIVLEKVRASTMAMQKIDDLGKVAQCLFVQMHLLGMKPGRAMIPIINQENDSAEAWIRIRKNFNISL